MERPILFSAPMVRAILEGRKTQTRRVVKINGAPAEGAFWDHRGWTPRVESHGIHWTTLDGRHAHDMGVRFRYGQPGDRLWVKETFAKAKDSGPHGRIEYRADHGDDSEVIRWTPSIFMPRWASRITLEVVAVRVERLNDISEADALAEGCGTTVEGYYPTRAIIMPNEIPATRNYCQLWESLNGAGSWAENPWVWVIEFRRAA